MKKKKNNKAGRQPIRAAGGIVMRGRARPLIAIVQLRRQKTWVLPKGKLARDETALAAAQREALEETGHAVVVHEFLGSLGYKTAGRPKIVKFWRMQASGRPVAKLMKDVRAVRWLSLTKAAATLTHERERLFLKKVGPPAIRRAAQANSKEGKASSRARNPRKTVRKRRKARTRADTRGKPRPGTRAQGSRRDLHALATTPAAPPRHRAGGGPHGRRDLVQRLWTWLRR